MFYLYSNLIQHDNLFREQMSKLEMLLIKDYDLQEY
jgi:hypothetical protein